MSQQTLIAIFSKKSDAITFDVKRLDIADIVISSKVAVERKEGSDFVSSIMDNRLFEQIVRLKDTYATPILILKGLNDKVFEPTGMKISSIYGALSMVSYKLGISVIPTRNIEDTAIVIERIAIREQSDEKGSLLARSASKTLDKSTRRAYIIEGLINTGPKKAKLLIDTFKTPDKVIQSIKHTEITYTGTGNPKGIKGPLEHLSGFGWKYIQKNKKILFGNKVKATR
jgi:Fanconi anemia group M protein